MATVKMHLAFLATAAAKLWHLRSLSLSQRKEKERKTKQGTAVKRLCQIECFGMHMILCFVIHGCIKAQANFVNKYLGGCRL
jgi:hypothetical protein